MILECNICLIKIFRYLIKRFTIQFKKMHLQSKKSKDQG